MRARNAWLKGALVLAVLAGWAGDAFARGGSRQTGSYETIGLSAIRANPKAFIGKRVSFDCFFAGLGRIYQPFQTPFVAEQYLNFHVWEPGTKLWDNRERRNAFLFCFIPRDLEKQTNYVIRRRMYESVRLFGRVTVVYADHPWFEIDDVQPSRMPGMTDTALQHIMVGLKSVRNGQFGMAEKSFDEAIKAGLPADAENFALRELGTTYYELGKHGEAAETFEKAARNAAEDPWVLLRWGQSLSRAADAGGEAHAKKRQASLREALVHLEVAGRRDPANADIHAEIGWAMAKLGNPGEGLRHVYEALALETSEKSAPSYRILGRIRVQLGELNAAEDAYVNAIMRDPTNPVYHREVADLVYMPLARYADAETEYKNLIKLTGAEPDGYLLLAKALLKQGGREDDARKSFDDALRQDGDNIEALLGRAAIYRDEQDYERAAADLNRAARLRPKDTSVLVARAEVLLARGEYDGAVKACDEIVRLKPRGSIAAVYFVKGVSLAGKRPPDSRGAVAALGLAVRNAPRNVDYRKTLARALVGQGQHRRAVNEYRQIAKQIANEEKTRLLYAEAMLEGGDVRSAKAELENMVQTMRDSAWAKNYLAYLIVEHERQPDLARAERLASAANDKEAGNADFQDTLGWIKYRQGEMDGARLLLDMAIIKSKRPEPFYHRAFLLKDSEPEVARENLEEALRRLNALTGKGVATRKLLQDALKLARPLGANPRPGPKEPAE